MASQFVERAVELVSLADRHGASFEWSAGSRSPISAARVARSSAISTSSHRRSIAVPSRRRSPRTGRSRTASSMPSTVTSASTSTAPTGCRSTCSWAGWTCVTTSTSGTVWSSRTRPLPAADLALSKLQIVEFTEKDQQDTRTLFEHLQIAERHDAIDPRRIQEVTCSDWGWHRTVSANLERFSGADDVVGERASRLLELMQEWPKSRRWNRRARVGTRKPWYRLPEEVAHGSAVGGA